MECAVTEHPPARCSSSPTRRHALSPCTVYDLVGVVNHYGEMGGGHYTADCCNPEDGKWYHYDDEAVHQVATTDLDLKAAYILFFQRRDFVYDEQAAEDSAAAAAVEDIDDML